MPTHGRNLIQSLTVHLCKAKRMSSVAKQPDSMDQHRWIAAVRESSPQTWQSASVLSAFLLIVPEDFKTIRYNVCRRFRKLQRSERSNELYRFQQAKYGDTIRIHPSSWARRSRSVEFCCNRYAVTGLTPSSPEKIRGSLTLGRLRSCCRSHRMTESELEF